MRYLLDTHIWIWAYSEPHKLSSEVVREVSEPANKLYLSAASIWEAILLLEKKRIQMGSDFGATFRDSREALGFMEVPVGWDVAHELRFTLLNHRDPVDRFLAATAKVYDLTLITSDERLLQVPGVKVLSNL